MWISDRVWAFLPPTIDIPTLTITGVDLDLEQTDGRSNLESVIDHLSTDSDDASEGGDSSVELTVGTLQINDITAQGCDGKTSVKDHVRRGFHFFQGEHH